MVAEGKSVCQSFIWAYGQQKAKSDLWEAQTPIAHRFQACLGYSACLWLGMGLHSGGGRLIPNVGGTGYGE